MVAQCGLPNSLIKMLGSWQHAAYTVYIWIPMRLCAHWPRPWFRHVRDITELDSLILCFSCDAVMLWCWWAGIHVLVGYRLGGCWPTRLFWGYLWPVPSSLNGSTLVPRTLAWVRGSLVSHSHACGLSGCSSLYSPKYRHGHMTRWPEPLRVM